MTWLHTWAGVTAGVVLFAIFWMGTLAIFDDEIDRWMMPPTRLAGSAEPISLDAVWKSHRPPAEAPSWFVTMPTQRNPTAQIGFRGSDGKPIRRTIDPSTGEILPETGTLAGSGFLYPFHVHLHIRVLDIGVWVVGFAGMAMLALIVSGVVIHKKIFADFFSLRFRRRERRLILDLHNVSGVLALPFHFVITLSGLVVFLSIYFPSVWHVSYSGDRSAFFREAFGANSQVRPKESRPGDMVSLDAMVTTARSLWGGDPIGRAAIYHPGDAGAFVRLGRSVEFGVSLADDGIYFDASSGAVLFNYSAVTASRVQRFIAGLHLIQFRHWTLRWLYFFLGLTGCVLIATGSLFWLESRRKKHAQLGVSGTRIVEGLTIGQVTGIVIATLTFFVANRLLPLGATFLGIERAAIEIWAFYLVWLASFGHAWMRPKRAWIEQCRAIAGFALVAVFLNWLTTGDHLIRSLSHDHLWPIAGMDAMLLTGAIVAALTARKLGRRASTGACTSSSDAGCREPKLRSSQ